MKEVKIKICDIRELDIAKYCEQKGVSFLGIHQIKYPLTEEKKELVNQIRAITNNIKLVLVTQEQDLDKLFEICSEFNWDYIQLHFRINPKDIIDLRKRLNSISMNPGIISVIDISDIERYDVNNLSKVSEFLLFDSSIRGGTGIQSSEQALRTIKRIAKGKEFFIAGGLNDKNVIDTIRTCEPYAVDVQSGVEFLNKNIYPELKHKKDPKRIDAFVNAVNFYNRFNTGRIHNNDDDEREI